MENYPNETSSDRSPFDLPKSFYYESINEYYLKKSEQLLRVKNFELAIKEFSGLLDCAVRNNDKTFAGELEDSLFKAKIFLAQRNEARQKLKFCYDKFIKDLHNTTGPSENFPIEELPTEITINNFGPLLKSIKIFTEEARLTEEYSNLIAKIFDFHTKNINQLSLNEASKTLRTSLEQVLTFDPLKFFTGGWKNRTEKRSISFSTF